MINEFRPMNHLTSLQNFICTIGNLPTSYALSLSYEEQIWWLCDFLEKKVFPAIEENTNITEETQQAFVELQNYVRDYFNNLDVQEEINNKLDEMVQDGTFENLVNDYISQLRFIRVSDYYNENDYIDLNNLYNIAIQNKKAIYIDGTYKLNVRCLINNGYVEIFGGKLIVDSFESTVNNTFTVFRTESPCYIHDIEIVSVADQIPSINRHAGIEYGYASNVKVATVAGSHITFERIKGDFIGGVHIEGASNNILTDIKLDKCYFNHCELGIFCEHAEFTCTNSTFIQSTDVQSIYYHPFYIARARNTNIDNIEIGVNALVHPNANLTDYNLPDIFHLYNADNNYEFDSYNINISNINVRGSNFKKFCQARFLHDINFNNINATIKKMFVELGNRYKNINFNNCNITTVNDDGQARTVLNTVSYVYSDDDSINISNSVFKYENGSSQYFSSSNLTLTNCKIISSDSNVTIPTNNDIPGYLKLIDCYIKLHRLTALYLGVGKVEYINCYFDNDDVYNYINSSNDNVLNVKVLNCYIATLKNMFEVAKINENVCFDVLGKNPDNNAYRHITNFVDIT